MEQQTTSDIVPVADRQPDADRKKLHRQIPNPGRLLSQGAERQDSAYEDYQYVTGFKLAIVVVSVTMVFFLVMLDLSIIATAIPHITSEFHSLPDVGWYGSAYLLANCSLQPLTGKFYTYFSSKYTFLTFLALFELGSLLCGVADSSNMLIIGRAVAGMGGSGLSNGAITIVAACVPLEKRPVFMGIMMSVSQVGTVLGPLLGGVLTQYTTWRWCFYINLPIGGGVAFLLMLIQIPDRTIKTGTQSTVRITLEKLDILGFALFAPAAIQFLLAIEWGGSRDAWKSATIIGLFCGATGTFCVFLAWEYRRGDSAMIPFSMVRRTIVWSSCLVSFLSMGSMAITSYYMPIYFQAVRNATPTMSGVHILPAILSQILFATVSGVLVGRLGYYLPWSIASGILTSLGTGLISTFTPTTSTGTWIGYQILAGAGRGCGMQMPLVAIQTALPQEQISVGIALLIFAQGFGGALFLAFAETDFTNGLTKAIKAFAPNVSAETVIAAGASAVRDVVPKADLGGAFLAYNQAIQHVFYLAAGAAAATLVFCWGMGWKSVKKAKVAKPEA